MTHFRAGPIKKLACGIFDGPHATSKQAEAGTIFLGIKNTTSQALKEILDFSEIRNVSEQEFPKWTRRVTPP
jgi:type I restriction enzyme S subunit